MVIVIYPFGCYHNLGFVFFIHPSIGAFDNTIGYPALLQIEMIAISIPQNLPTRSTCQPLCAKQHKIGVPLRTKMHT